MKQSLRVQVRDPLGDVQRQREPDRPGQRLLAELDQLLKAAHVDVLKEKK